jgi:hypothetical protein
VPIFPEPAQLDAEQPDDPRLGFTLLSLNTRFTSRHTRWCTGFRWVREPPMMVVFAKA